MPDVLEMPYRPPLLEQMIQKRTGSQFALEDQPACQEMIGDYKFRQLPGIWGSSYVWRYTIYTTCKNNTFNGMPLPDIWLRRADNTMQQLTDFVMQILKKDLEVANSDFLFLVEYMAIVHYKSHKVIR